MTDFRSVPAAVASRAANAGGLAALFTATHNGPNSGTPPTGATPPTDPAQVAAETLAVHLAGAGFHIHTQAPNKQATRPGTATNAPLNDPGSGGHLLEGGVVINPEVRNDPTTGTEVLLTIRHDPWLQDFADSHDRARLSPHGRRRFGRRPGALRALTRRTVPRPATPAIARTDRGKHHGYPTAWCCGCSSGWTATTPTPG